MATGLTFDAATHTYTMDGRKVTSVTQILNDVIQPHYGGDAERNMARGSALHAGYEILGRGGEIAECDPDQRAYYDAWRKWVRLYGIEFIGVEQMVVSSLYQYAGTYDAKIAIRGKLYLCDYKSTIHPELAGWQMSGYAIADGSDTMPRVAVQIDPALPEGVRMVWYESKADIRKYNNEWLAILTAYRCRRRMVIQERK